MRPKKLQTIICPNCGREYLPCEIYLPKSFMGDAKNIIKNESGKIESFIGSNMDLDEQFTCDSCDATFKVTTKIQFITEVSPELSFNEDYTTTIQKQQLLMTED